LIIKVKYINKVVTSVTSDIWKRCYFIPSGIYSSGAEISEQGYHDIRARQQAAQRLPLKTLRWLCACLYQSFRLSKSFLLMNLLNYAYKLRRIFEHLRRLVTLEC
jgi:hypothetical protein